MIFPEHILVILQELRPLAFRGKLRQLARVAKAGTKAASMQASKDPRQITHTSNLGLSWHARIHSERGDRQQEEGNVEGLERGGESKAVPHL